MRKESFRFTECSPSLILHFHNQKDWVINYEASFFINFYGILEKASLYCKQDEIKGFHLFCWDSLSTLFSVCVLRPTNFWRLPDCRRRRSSWRSLTCPLKETGREIDAGPLLFFFFLHLCTTLVDRADVLFDLSAVVSRLVCSRAATASYSRLTAPG